VLGAAVQLSSCPKRETLQPTVSAGSLAALLGRTEAKLAVTAPGIVATTEGASRCYFQVVSRTGRRDLNVGRLLGGW